MVSPRTPAGKRYGPSEQEVKGGGVEYIDPFKQYNERQEVRSEGWLSWAGTGVLWGLEGASSAISSRTGYKLGARQQDIPREFTQSGSSLELNDFNDGHDIREEARLVHNALTAFRNAEVRGDSNVVISEAEHAAWKRWEAREAELRQIEGERVQRGRGLEQRKRVEQRVSVPLPSRGAPGILVPGQGFIPVGETPATVPSTPSQNVPFPQPSVPPNLPPSLFPSLGRSTSSFQPSSSSIPTRRNWGATSRAKDLDSDSSADPMGRSPNNGHF